MFDKQKIKDLQSSRVESLSIDELKEVIAHKEQELNVVKEGFLKENLYIFRSKHARKPNFAVDPDFLTGDEMEKLIHEFKDQFELAVKKGTRFVAYWYYDSLMWYDDIGYGIEEKEDHWAEKYLENIREIRRGR